MKKLSRTQAVDRLRVALEALDDEHSTCYVAARRGIFCGGFAQWKFHELKERYPQIVRSRPHLTRAQLEELADRWQTARQFALGTTLACDTQTLEKEFQTCKGWGEFSDAQIAAFVEELCGDLVEIVPQRSSRVS